MYYTTDDRTTNWGDIEVALAHHRQVMVWGPPGLGKTFAALKMGLPSKKQVRAITLTPETPAAELRGHHLPGKGGAFVWHDGPLVEAMVKGYRLVINEISHAGPDVMAMLYPILEDISTAQLTLPNNKVIEAHPDFQIVCTDNDSPTVLPEAIQSRLLPFYVGELHPSAIESLPKQYRNAVKGSVVNRADPNRAISFRHWLAFIRLEEKIGRDMAARLVFKKHAREITSGLAMRDDLDKAKTA